MMQPVRTPTVPQNWTMRLATVCRKAIEILEGYPWHDDPSGSAPQRFVDCCVQFLQRIATLRSEGSVPSSEEWTNPVLAEDFRNVFGIQMQNASDHVEAQRRLDVIARWCEAQDPEVFLWATSPDVLQSITEELADRLSDCQKTLGLSATPDDLAVNRLVHCLSSAWAGYWMHEWMLDRFKPSLDTIHTRPLAVGPVVGSTATEVVWLLMRELLDEADCCRDTSQMDDGVPAPLPTGNRSPEGPSAGEIPDDFCADMLRERWQDLRSFVVDLFDPHDADQLRVAVRQECGSLKDRLHEKHQKQRSLYCSSRKPITLAEVGLDRLCREAGLEPVTDTVDLAHAEEVTRPKYQYKSSGENFHVRFDGEEGDIRKELLGAQYIYRLLQQPDRPIDVVDLYAGTLDEEARDSWRRPIYDADDDCKPVHRVARQNPSNDRGDAEESEQFLGERVRQIQKDTTTPKDLATRQENRGSSTNWQTSRRSLRA